MFASSLTVGFSLGIQTQPTGTCVTLILTRFSVDIPAIHAVYTTKETQRNTVWIYNAR
jgi:hypothetical protein